MTEALYSSTGLSFWGGIEETTGNVIDLTHPLHLQCISDKVLVIPGGRGSCTGSQSMLELILNKKSPRALVLRDADAILCTGAVVAEEFFPPDTRDNVPIICAVGAETFKQLVEESTETLSVRIDESDPGDVRIENGQGVAITVKNLLRLPNTLNVDGINPNSDAEALALRTIERVASISGARELIPISNAHIDAVTYIGPGGLKFIQRLVELGGMVQVPTTLNSQSVDRRRWRQMGVDEVHGTNANAVGDAYLELGCELSFTCAPYLLESRPKFGQQIMWGESNAVVFANSVLGARTEKYADYFDICSAIVGFVPNIGMHEARNRVPNVVIDATDLIRTVLVPSLDDNDNDIESFFPAMGWLCGSLSDGGIPLIIGLESISHIVTRDALKAFCAAFGTTASSPLFHLANITPEAQEMSDIEGMLASCGDNKVVVSKQDLLHAYETLDSGKGDGDDISLVALGNPHLSKTELHCLSTLVTSDSRGKHPGVRIMACLGRQVQTEGKEDVEKLESFGVEFVNDTCWCMLLDPPIIPHDKKAKIMTNSGKYSHYGPGLTNRSLRFGSMRDCVEASKTGRLANGEGTNLPVWLQLRSFTSRALLTIRKIR